jgi:hypothetical protein
MSQTITGAPYSAYQSQAMIGMKADSMDDNVDTFAAAAPIPVGVVVSRVAPFDLKVQAGGTAMVGIALHDHTIGSRGGYIQYDAVSVLTRGRCWVRLSSATNVDDGVYVHYNPADGTCAATGTKLLNAVFRSKAASLPDASQVVWGSGVTTLGAVVELHYPLADPASTVLGGMAADAGPTEETKRFLDAVNKSFDEQQKQWEEQQQREEEMRRQQAEDYAKSGGPRSRTIGGEQRAAKTEPRVAQAEPPKNIETKPAAAPAPVAPKPDSPKQ